MHITIKRAAVFAVATSLAALAAGQAQAQASADEPASADATFSDREIIVLANKRRENLQEVPIAITAVAADRLENVGITSTTDLARVVPGLVMSTGPSGTKPTLRGVGSFAVSVGSENSIATYVDGVYLLSLSGALVQLSNIEQIEVLKGPQGTLFGRNATGGVLSIRTRDPKHEIGGDVRVRYGNYDTVSAQAYLTAGLGEHLAVDIAGFLSHQGDGWGVNTVNGKDIGILNEYAVRSKWLFTPGDRDEFRLIGDYSEVTGNRYNSSRLLIGESHNYGPGATVAGQRPDLAPFVASGALAPFAEVGTPYVYNGGFYDIEVFTQPQYKVKSYGGSLQWDHDFGGVRTMSLTAYRRTDTDLINQFAAVPGPRSIGSISQADTQFSQEFQVAAAEGAAIPWVVGVYYLDGKGKSPDTSITGSTLAPLERLRFEATVTTESGAAFGQATVPIWEGAHFTGGLRYTIEKRSVEGRTIVTLLPAFGGATTPGPLVQADKTYRKLTWRIALDQKLTPDILAYISYNRGFKSGLFNGIPPSTQPVKPEVLDAYEAGLKTELFDRAVRLNVAGFYYDYENIQVTVVGPVSAFLDNGARARAYGADIDLVVWLGDRFTIFGAATLMDSEFRSYDSAAFHTRQPLAAGGGVIGSVRSAAGNKLPYAPAFSFNIGAAYNAPVAAGELQLNVNLSHTGKWYSAADNQLAQPGYELLDASATYTFGGGNMSVGVWGRNLTGTKYYTILTSQANPGGGRQGLPGSPRTYGVQVGYKF